VEYIGLQDNAEVRHHIQTISISRYGRIQRRSIDMPNNYTTCPQCGYDIELTEVRKCASCEKELCVECASSFPGEDVVYCHSCFDKEKKKTNEHPNRKKIICSSCGCRVYANEIYPCTRCSGNICNNCYYSIGRVKVCFDCHNILNPPNVEEIQPIMMEEGGPEDIEYTELRGD